MACSYGGEDLQGHVYLDVNTSVNTQLGEGTFVMEVYRRSGVSSFIRDAEYNHTSKASRR